MFVAFIIIVFMLLISKQVGHGQWPTLIFCKWEDSNYVQSIATKSCSHEWDTL